MTDRERADHKVKTEQMRRITSGPPRALADSMQHRTLAELRQLGLW